MPFPKDPRLAQMDEDIRTVVSFKDGELVSPNQFNKTDVAWLLNKYFEKQYPMTDDLETRVQRRLSYIADKKDGFVVRYKEKGKVRKGIYTLRKTKPQNAGASKNKPPKTNPQPPQTINNGTIELPESPIVDACPSADTYLGKAGEMAVSSELLYRGYNISLMAVDDGIDIVAIKSNKTFLIQVKTMQSHDNKTFKTHIKRSSFDRYRNGDCFYVFVMRKKDQNTFVVMGANEIDSLMLKGAVVNNPLNINLSFRLEGSKVILGRSEDITYAKGHFDVIR